MHCIKLCIIGNLLCSSFFIIVFLFFLTSYAFGNYFLWIILNLFFYIYAVSANVNLIILLKGNAGFFYFFIQCDPRILISKRCCKFPKTSLKCNLEEYFFKKSRLARGSQRRATPALRASRPGLLFSGARAR